MWIIIIIYLRHTFDKIDSHSSLKMHHQPTDIYFQFMALFTNNSREKRFKLNHLFINFKTFHQT